MIMASEVSRQLPASTSDSVILTLTEWLREKLKETDFGEVGLVFTVHNNVVVKYQKVDIRRCAIAAGEGETVRWNR